MSILSAIGDAGALISSQRAVTSIAAGDRGDSNMALNQWAIVSVTLAIVGEALKALKFGPIPAFPYYACCLTPFILAYAMSRNIQNDRCKQATVFAQDAIVPLCQLSSFVSGIAMLYFGFTAVGVASLTILALGAIEQSGKASVLIRSWIRTVTYPLSEICGIFSRNWISRVIGILTVVGLAIERVSKTKQKAKAKEPIDAALKFEDLKRMLPAWERWGHVVQAMRSLFEDPKNTLGTVGAFDSLVAPQKSFFTRIKAIFWTMPDENWRAPLADALRNTGHPDFLGKDDNALLAEARKVFEEVGSLDLDFVHFKTMPRPDPATSLDTFIQLLDSKIGTDRARVLETLRVVLASDEKFLQTEKALDTFSDEDLISFLRKAANEFVSQIRDRTIKEGEPSPEGYQYLQDHLRLIIERLPQQDPQHMIEHLVNLSVRGKYCGPGKFEIIENTVSAVVLGTRTTPLVMKFLGHLQMERKLISHQKLYILEKNPITKRLTSVSEQHGANFQLNQMGKDWGIPNASGEYDEAGAVPSYAILVQALGTWTTNRVFTLKHPLSLPVDAIQEQIKNQKSISIQDVKTWWKEWIQKQQLSDAEKESFQQGVDRYEILGCSLVTEANKINPPVILAMLASMGVTKIPAAT